MSDKLVKRLRSPANVFYEYAADGGAFLREAADRIEKLEEALQEITESARLVGDYYHVKIARKALEEKPDMSVYKEGYRAVEEAMGHPSPEFWIGDRND